jgi:hypothetical protein
MTSGNRANQKFINWLRVTKRNISKIPAGAYFANKVRKTIFRYWFKNQEELFTYYFNTNKWGNKESLSGPGSSFSATEKIRKHLPNLLNELKVHTILDAPCGDYYWFKLISLPPDLEYIGGDIVNKVIDLNNKQFGNGQTRFIHLDILVDKLPEVEIWLCRDVLFHFSFNDVEKVFENLKNSRIRYFLSTTYPETNQNIDIETGDFRPINLEIEPFNLPVPLIYLDDSSADQPGKKLGLWDVTKIF